MIYVIYMKEWKTIYKIIIGPGGVSVREDSDRPESLDPQHSAGHPSSAHSVTTRAKLS